MCMYDAHRVSVGMNFIICGGVDFVEYWWLVIEIRVYDLNAVNCYCTTYGPRGF